MKKLLTLFFLTLLSVMSMQAQNAFLHLWASSSSPINTENLPGSGGNTWTYIIPGMQFDTWGVVKNEGTYNWVYLVPCINVDGANKWGHPDSYSTFINSGQEYTYSSSSSYSSDSGLRLPDKYSTRTFKFYIYDYSNNNGTVSFKLKISWSGPGEASLTLRTSAHVDGSNDWIGVKNNEFDSDNNTYIWYLDALSNFTSSSTFKLKLNKTWYGSGSSVGNSWSTLTSSGGNCTPVIPSLTAGQIVRLEAKPDGRNWKARIVAGDGAHQYYWVSPQITNGEKWPSFRMDASRNRYWSGTKVIGDGLTSTKYYTFTIKDDDLVTWKTKKKIGPNTPIQWWIERDDGKVVYRPTSDLVNDTPVGYDSDHPGAGQLDRYVSYKNYWNGTGYAGEGAYMTTTTPHNTGSWSLLRKVGTNNTPILAHTFNLNADKGHVLYNYTTTGHSDSGFELAGNWAAGKEVSITLSTDNNDKKPKAMSKYWYKTINNVKQVSNEEIADADSIVYKVKVDKPTDGWGGLYLVVFPTSESRNWDAHPAVLRPLITMGNNLDGRALHGALTTSNSEQSLNPEPESYYTAYTFSFNATTMTYRLEFHMPDATLSPGTEDGNHDFPNTTNENISVVLSKEDDIHSKAVNYAIGFGTDKYFTLDETTKYTDASFNLTYDGTSNSITYTSSDNNFSGTISNSNTIYVKVRGYDGAATPNYGDIHTYQYTFHSKISCTPNSGFFINSANLTIQGGTPPYTYEIVNYGTKEENGETVIDFTTETQLTSGTFTSANGNNRISTPGFLKITDSASPTPNSVTYAEVGGGFDFTYSTSENYQNYYNNSSTNLTPNGADYYRVMNKDKTNKLDPTWNSSSNITLSETVTSWDMVNRAHTVTGSVSQTVKGLTANEEYAVQALVNSVNMDDITLTLSGSSTNSSTLGTHYGGKKNFVNKYGRVEFLDNQVDKNTDTNWQVLYANAQASESGELTITLSCDNGTFNLADVVLLEGTATNRKYIMSVTTGQNVTEVDLSDRSQYNAFSFFNRGINRNSVIYVSDHTVLGAKPGLITGDDNTVDRRHPYNVAAYNADKGTYYMKKMYLTDQQSAGQNGNDNDFGVSKTFTVGSFYYDRSISSATNKMSTYLPIPLSSDQIPGGTAYVLNQVDEVNKTISFKGVTSVEANTPFFFVSGKTGVVFDINSEMTVSPSPDFKTPSEATSGNENYMLGFYHWAQNLGNETTGYRQNGFVPYSYQNGYFRYLIPTAKVNPFRAIFMHYSNSANPANQIAALWLDDVVTGITELPDQSQDSSAIYSIDGKMVSKDGNIESLHKGIYIKAGKKFVVK